MARVFWPTHVRGGRDLDFMKESVDSSRGAEDIVAVSCNALEERKRRDRHSNGERRAAPECTVSEARGGLEFLVLNDSIPFPPENDHGPVQELGQAILHPDTLQELEHDIEYMSKINAAKGNYSKANNYIGWFELRSQLLVGQASTQGLWL